ncbi:MAG: sodium-translocating pyrophosphatase [Candidatus Bathyarchaeota archaeon]|nr:MAG: sodium-translocating pyrophosphatase [Candidatus Bathyarchaeota archaeon]
MVWILIAPIAALAAVFFSVYLYFYVNSRSTGTPRMLEISEAIKEGARAFLRREYIALAIFVVIMAVILTIAIGIFLGKGIEIGPAYIFGSVCSALAGFLGMEVAIRANVRTAYAARKGLNKAFPIAFRGGAVMGLSVVGLALLGISVIYFSTGKPELVLGFSFGASAMALFAKAGGGIYTKTADVGADLVGKVEMSIPEDDPRNPAVIADNVGDNVGDVAGMGADLFDSYVASIVAVMILGEGLSLVTPRENLVSLPLIFAGLGVIASLIGVAIVRVGKKGNPGKALNWGTYFTCVVLIGLTFIVTYVLEFPLAIWGALTVGLVAGIIIGITTDYFTSIDRMPAKRTAESSQTGAAINIISGFSYGLISMFPPLLGIGIGSAVAFFICELGIGPGFGVYGVGMSAVGMLSIVGMIVAGDAYGPIVDNAKGIAEQAGMEEEVIDIADRLDAAGNTAKAITKGFAIGAAGLTVISLLAAYQAIVQREAGIIIFDLMNPFVFTGALIGIAMPALFSAMVMLGVGKNAFRMIKEIRRQFREIPGLKEGKEGVKPDYARCVDIAAKGALRELLPPSTIIIVATLAVGFVGQFIAESIGPPYEFGGIQALGGYLGGSIFSGLIFALLMANSGGLWDNAKKYIEAGELGGTGSDAHKAAVVGDTVGDPFKDTAGPSLNTMITVMSLVASEFAPLIVAFALLY